jgi:hypothetical protein
MSKNLKGKYSLVIKGKKIQNFHIIERDEFKRQFFEEFDSLEDFSSFLSSSKLMSQMKILVSTDSEDNLTGFSLTSEKEPLPRQYIFDSLEEAQNFSDSQGLEKSIHLQSDNVKDIIADFFEGKKVDFKDSNKLKKDYEKELEAAGGAKCTSCAKGSLMRKYQDIILQKIN